jgi:hypothetical protein
MRFSGDQSQEYVNHNMADIWPRNGSLYLAQHSGPDTIYLEPKPWPVYSETALVPTVYFLDYHITHLSNKYLLQQPLGLMSHVYESSKDITILIEDPSGTPMVVG